MSLAAEMIDPSPVSLPPGPGMPPFVQVLHWVYRPVELLRDSARRFGDAFTIRWPRYPPLVFVSHPDAIRDAFTGDPATFHAGPANVILRPILGDRSLLLLDGERHARERRLMMPPFHGERMHAYGAAMRAIADASIDAWPTGRPFALHERTQAITLDVILRTVFGVDEGAAFARLRGLIQTLLEGSVARLMLLLVDRDGGARGSRILRLLGPLSPWEKLARLLGEIDRILFAEIARRRAGDASREDVLSMLVAARDEHGAPMTDADLRDEMMTLLLAGHETTATTLTWIVHRLLENPDVLARLRDELPEGRDPATCEYLDAVVREAMRLTPIIPIVGRKLLAPARIGALALPAGVVVAPCIYLAHRRADAWPDPERFDPARFLGKKVSPYSFLPFGGGARRCLGMAFAMFEMKLVVAQIVRRAALRHAPGYRGRLVRRGITFALEGGLRLVADRIERAAPRP
ncbi:MAG: cytochrome P450 [Myxococcota bacterium]